MSVQIELPLPRQHHTTTPPTTSNATATQPAKPSSPSSRLRSYNMLSESQSSSSSSSSTPASTSSPNPGLALRREQLKLSFNRSISEPHPGAGPNPPVLSPPSLSPSLHPSKRCRMESPSQMMPPPQMPMPAAAAAAAAPTTTQPKSSLSPNNGPMATVSLPNSPCSESSTLQRTILLRNASTIYPDQLASRLEQRRHSNDEAFLLVDCRPFMAFNINHIRGGINVNCCDRFNRKRLQQGKASLADLATTKEGKELLKRRSWKDVVVYDDCSDSLERLPATHTLFLVINALIEDQRRPIMLLGGLRDFSGSYRSLCEDHLMTSTRSSSSVQQQQHPSFPSLSAASTPLPDLPSPSDLCDTKDIANHPATEVLPFLYLGNMRDASDAAALRRLNIKYVLNVTTKTPEYVIEPDLIYKQLEAADNGFQNLRQFFEEAFAFIDSARLDGSGVLVHCHAGVSRSPTIAVAYLMKNFPAMAMADAYKFVKTRRSIISPNLNFMGQLWEFEQGLKRSRTEDDNNEKNKFLSTKLLSEAPAANPSPGTAPAILANANSPFRWTEAAQQQQQQQQQPQSESGCSV